MDERRSAPPGPAPFPCRMYLVRHGRTVLNAQGRFRGQEDPSLDRIGREEARRAAHLLVEAPLDAVYSSPLRRARETAGVIASLHGLDVQEVPDLRDLDYGLWSGRTSREAERSDGPLYQLFRSEPEAVTPPGGESVTALAKRVVDSLHIIALRHEGGSGAVVTHELPIRLVLARATNGRGGALWKFRIPTGSVRRVSVERQHIHLPSRAGARVWG